jgi:hypothetical protein
MKSLIHIFSFLLFTSIISGWFYSYANNKDSLNNLEKKDTLKVNWVNENAFDYKNVNHFYKRRDTSLTGIQKYELLTFNNPFIAKFSNVGLAYRNLDFNTDYCFDFVSSAQYFKDYFLTNENAKYYNLLTPFVDVYYVMGSKKEQTFNLLYTRNIKKNLNISIQYKLIHSDGLYLLQKSDDAFVILTSNYSTKNKRYVVLGNYFYNRMKIQENGGLFHIDDFTSNSKPNRQLDTMNLWNNDNAANHVRESGFYVKQFLFLSFNKHRKDSTKTKEPEYFGFGRISHSILFKNQSYAYLDGNPNSGFYPKDAMFNKTQTNDSIHVNTIENTLAWSNLRFKNLENIQHFLIQFSIKDKYSKLHGILVDTSFYSILPQAEMNLRIGKEFEFFSNGFYTIYGHNKGDYSLTGTMKYMYDHDTLSSGYVGAKAEMFRQSPMWFDQTYYANNIFWNNKFNATNTEKANLFFNYNTLDLNFNYFLINNYIYFDYYAKPKQLNAVIQIAQVSLNKNFKWRGLELDNKILYQKSTYIKIVRLPDLMSNHAFYITKAFHNNLIAQLGLEATFFSSYYPLAWMPNTREFYIQNTFKSDNYVYVDFFFNVKIKRARIYVKVDHLNSGLTGYDYIMIPNYPMAERAFKFGVSWMFYN